jgi:hypothetical protein
MERTRMAAGDVASFIAAGAAVLALVGAYVQYVLRRSLLPSAEFDVEYQSLRLYYGYLVGEVSAVIRNAGSNMLIVKKVRFRARFITSTEDIEPWKTDRPGDCVEPNLRGRISPKEGIERDPGLIPHEGVSPAEASMASSLSDPSPLTEDEVEAAKEGEFVDFVRERTFVQPGVTQRYRKPMLLPPDVSVVNILGSFDYSVQIGWLTKKLIWIFARPPEDLDWRDGIDNHTVRRSFAIATLGPHDGV